MASMVAPINIGLQFRGNWCNAKKKIEDKAGEFLKLRLNSSSNTNKGRFSLLGCSSSRCSRRGVDTINAMEHDVPLVHLARDKLAKESTAHTTLRGRFVEDRFVYRQTFLVRSYDIRPDKTITMEILMNFL